MPEKNDIFVWDTTICMTVTSRPKPWQPDRIFELAKNAESLWKARSSRERVDFLKLLLSNQELKINSETREPVSVEYTLLEPLQKLAEIKKKPVMKPAF